MPRPYEFPDVNDRSPNAPSTIVDDTKVLALYNQEHPTEKAKYVSETVRTWFLKAAKEKKWPSASFHGNQCVMSILKDM